METVDLQKQSMHLNSMLQIGFINSLQQLLKKQSQSMSSCVIWLPELEGLIKPSTLGKIKDLVTALLSHASSRHNEISLRLSETLSAMLLLIGMRLLWQSDSCDRCIF